MIIYIKHNLSFDLTILWRSYTCRTFSQKFSFIYRAFPTTHNITRHNQHNHPSKVSCIFFQTYHPLFKNISHFSNLFFKFTFIQPNSPFNYVTQNLYSFYVQNSYVAFLHKNLYMNIVRNSPYESCQKVSIQKLIIKVRKLLIISQRLLPHSKIIVPTILFYFW